MQQLVKHYCQWKFWVTPFLAIVLSAIGFCFSFFVPIHDQIVFDSDPNLQFPYLPNTVPMWSLYLSAFLTFAVVLIYSGIIYHDWNEVILAAHAWVAGVSIDWFLVNTIKTIVGRPRPNFFHNPDPNSARVSFPSGHTGFSFTIFHLLSLWMLAKSRSKYFPGRFRLAAMLVFLSPHLIAIWVSITRIQDYHHHYSDVVAGALIGIVSARIAFFSHFPDADNITLNSDDW